MPPRKAGAAPDASKPLGFNFRPVPSDLNLWPPGEEEPPKGTTLVGLVSHVTLAGQYGLQVKVVDPGGVIWTLASHKVLQGRLESVPGGLRPLKTVVKITFVGTEKSKKWPTPMRMYDVEYADRIPGESDLWPDLPVEVGK